MIFFFILEKKKKKTRKRGTSYKQRPGSASVVSANSVAGNERSSAHKNNSIKKNIHISVFFFRTVQKRLRISFFLSVAFFVCLALQVLPGRAEEEDVLSLGQVNHLSFQPQTADLHPRQLVLILYGLHVQQALLSGSTSRA